jgi:calpain-7
MFPYDEHSGCPRFSPNGRYIFKFNFNGCYRMVDIDDRLPVSKSHRVLHVVDRNNPNLIWPALLEKAYLKLRGGYDFRGSNSSTDIWVMYGWVPEQIYLHQLVRHSFSASSLISSAYDLAVWEKVADEFVAGNVLITMGTGSMSPLEEKEYGLASRHDYAVIDVLEEGQAKKLLLKNPWCGETLWQDRNHADSIDATNKTEQPRGTFWITFEDVFQHFVSIYLNWNPAKFKHRQDIHFSWTVFPKSSGSATYIDNPQISLKARESGGVWILLSHHFCEGCGHASPESEPVEAESTATVEPPTGPKDQNTNSSIGSIALSAFKNHGKLVYTRDGAIKNGSFVESFHALLTINTISTETYTIVVAEDDLPARDHTFTMTAFSNGPVELSPATGEYAYSTSIESSWAGEVEGPSHPISDTSRTQLKMSISAPTKFSMLLKSEAANDKINLKICHGGKRIHSLRRQDIILDSGELHNGADFCESGPELFQPGDYTVVASVFGKPSGKTFTLRTDSSVPLQIRAIPSEDAGKFTLSLPDAVFNPSVKKVAMSLDPLRYITITAIGRYTKRLLTLTSEPPISGSPVRLSLEIGQGPMKHIAAVSNNGEYSDSVGSAARLSDLNLNPDMNSLGTLWLVVERLSTAIGDVPEHYKMDLLIAGGVGEHLKISSWQDRDDD